MPGGPFASFVAHDEGFTKLSLEPDKTALIDAAGTLEITGSFFQMGFGAKSSARRWSDCRPADMRPADDCFQRPPVVFLSDMSTANLVLVALYLSAALHAADSAKLVSASTPGNTTVTNGMGYEEKWTFTNTGTTTWGPNYSLQYISGNAGCSHAAFPLGTNAPGANYWVELNCTAPSTPGTYSETWQMVGPSGPILIGGSKTLTIQIVSATTDAATFVGSTVPDNTAEAAGQAYTVKITMQNNGTSTWDAGHYNFQYVSGNAGCSHETYAASGIAPGMQQAMTLVCTAPAAAGTYREDWRLAGPQGTLPIAGNLTAWVIIVVK